MQLTRISAKRLRSVYTMDDQPIVEIPLADLMAARLIGHPDAKRRRERLSELLQIGQVNGKGLKKRLGNVPNWT